MGEEIRDRTVVPLTQIHMAIGETPKSVLDLLCNLMKKAERGELTGLSASWVEGQNNIAFSFAAGSAPFGLLVAGVTALSYEMNKQWAEW